MSDIFWMMNEKNCDAREANLSEFLFPISGLQFLISKLFLTISKIPKISNFNNFPNLYEKKKAFNIKKLLLENGGRFRKK